MNKRTFLKSLFAGGGGGLFGLATSGIVSPAAAAPVALPPARHLVEHPISVLEEFNAQFLGYEFGERIDQYVVFFTGLKPHQDHPFLVGQWLAWPSRESVAGMEPRFFYTSVPLAFDAGNRPRDGEYRPGDKFHHGVGIDKGVLMSAEGRSHVKGLVRDGRRRIDKILRDAGVLL